MRKCQRQHSLRLRNLITGLTRLANEKNWKVHGRRMRIYAIGLDTKGQWNRDKDQDVWLCPKDGYLARNRMTFSYTFNK